MRSEMLLLVPKLPLAFRFRNNIPRWIRLTLRTASDARDTPESLFIRVCRGISGVIPWNYLQRNRKAARDGGAESIVRTSHVE